MQLQSVDKNADGHDPRQRLDVPRVRWGRRFGVAFVIGILLLIGGYIGWATSAGNALERQVAAYRAAGEPIEVADFAVSTVRDADNAVPFLRDAAKLDTTTAAWKAFDKLSNGDVALPLTDRETKVIGDVTAENAKAFTAIDQAMTRSGVDWKVPWSSPAISILLPDLHTQRQLAWLVAMRARLNYQRGDHAAAIADVRRAMFIGSAVDRQPILVSHLVGVGISALSAQTLSEMTPGLNVGKGPQDVKPADLSQLIAELLDDKPSRDAYCRALEGERALELDCIRCLADGRLSFSTLGAPAGGAGRGGGTGNAAAEAVGRVAGRPMLYGDGLIMMRHATAQRDAMRQSTTWPQYKSIAPPVPPEVLDSRFSHVFAKALLPSFEHSARTEFRVMTGRRLVATSLAVRQYVIDHDGKLPAKLADLVPAYLSAVPDDPFATAGVKLKLVVDADKPLVYSVGDNGKDEGGSEQPTQSARNPANAGRWDRLDAVMHLKLQARPPAATQQADDSISDGVGDLNVTTQPATTQP